MVGYNLQFDTAHIVYFHTRSITNFGAALVISKHGRKKEKGRVITPSATPTKPIQRQNKDISSDI